jgi:hypothetical protein
MRICFLLLWIVGVTSPAIASVLYVDNFEGKNMGGEWDVTPTSLRGAKGSRYSLMIEPGSQATLSFGEKGIDWSNYKDYFLSFYVYIPDAHRGEFNILGITISEEDPSLIDIGIKTEENWELVRPLFIIDGGRWLFKEVQLPGERDNDFEPSLSFPLLGGDMVWNPLIDSETAGVTRLIFTNFGELPLYIDNIVISEERLRQ